MCYTIDSKRGEGKGPYDRWEHVMIEHVKNYVWVCQGMLESMEAGMFHGRETMQGVKWAIKFVSSLDHDVMTEKELNHAIRLTYFRGQVCPKFSA